ncbi:MAG: sugar phosphate isomerase/epimerase [Clostridia bacterium]|nr:sugar phosphate isomerase/epimerase [Clostridia bacterium]
MKLGAQFFSIRDITQTEEGLRRAFDEIKKIGYDVVQLSGIGPIEAEVIKDIVDEYSMPVTCTHQSFDNIVNNTEKTIKDHITYGCSVIGLGSMPNEYRGSLEGVRQFLKDVSEPMKKIEAAGLRFAYHNHAFEFEGQNVYDVMIEEAPSMNFILDTYWVKYGGYDYLEYIKKIGADRMTNVHFKDMATEPKGVICPCGVGVIDFKPVIELCDSLGIPYALVEQDNAPSTGDSIGQMKISHDNLRPLF